MRCRGGDRTREGVVAIVEKAHPPRLLGQRRESLSAAGHHGGCGAMDTQDTRSLQVPTNSVPTRLITDY